MGRPPLARVAGFALGVAIALAIVAVEFEPAGTLWLTLAFATAVVGAALAILALRAARGPADADAARIRSDGILGRGTVLATYGIQAPSLRALADALAGAAPITGRLPVRLQSV